MPEKRAIFSSIAGQIVELGLAELPDIIAALKEKAPDLDKILAKADNDADIVISKAKEQLNS